MLLQHTPSIFMASKTEIAIKHKCCGGKKVITTHTRACGLSMTTHTNVRLTLEWTLGRGFVLIVWLEGTTTSTACWCGNSVS